MRVIVISAHPDDETLGAGGSILWHKERGDEVIWLNATSIFENQGYTRDRIDDRSEEIDTVSRAYGVNLLYNLHYPTTSLSHAVLPNIIQDISSVFQEVRPSVVYCPNRSDAHSDHRVLFEAVMACTKVFRYPYIKSVLMYECLSETEFAPQLHDSIFIPNYFIDITNHLEKKIDIMKIYRSELGEHPFPRSLEGIRALATLRGSMAGVKYAEAFQVVKIIT